MRRNVSLVLVVVVAVAGGILWWRSRATEPEVKGSKTEPVAVNVGPPTPSATLAPAAQQVTEKQEQQERDLLVAIATELKLTQQQSDRLVAILGEMQNGRRTLFAELATRKLAVEDVSSRLRDLREAMHAAFAKEVGEQHAIAIRERMRLAHGGEPTK